jgi:hypothetical protein
MLYLHVLTGGPLQVGSITGYSNGILVQDVDSGWRETLCYSPRREDPKSVENEQSGQSGDSVKSPDGNTGLKHLVSLSTDNEVVRSVNLQ